MVFLPSSMCYNGLQKVPRSAKRLQKKPQKHKTRVSQVLKQCMKRSSGPREEEGPAQPPRLPQFLPHSGGFPSKDGSNFPTGAGCGLDSHTYQLLLGGEPSVLAGRVLVYNPLTKGLEDKDGGRRCTAYFPAPAGSRLVQGRANEDVKVPLFPRTAKHQALVTALTKKNQ